MPLKNNVVAWQPPNRLERLHQDYVSHIFKTDLLVLFFTRLQKKKRQCMNLHGTC